MPRQFSSEPTTEDYDALAAAADKLVQKLEYVHAHPAYESVWSVSQMHVGPYRGPTYTDELAALKAALI